MQVSFADEYWQQLYVGRAPGKPKFSASVIRQYQKTIRALSQAESTDQLRQFRSLNFEALRGNLQGYHSVRVNRQYRIILTVVKDKIQLSGIEEEALIVEKMNKHYE